MMTTTAVRKDFRVIKTALYGSLFAIAVATSPLDAFAAADPRAPADQAAVLAPLPGVLTMAPIPDPVIQPSSSDENADPVLLDAPPPDEKQCLATAIYFEARGESAKGQQAVAEVIVTRARTRGRPHSICGVVYEGSQRKTGCQFSFTCDRVSDRVRDQAAWSRARRVATSVMRTRGRGKSVTRGATNYHASYVTPYWASSMVKVATIGTHIFYRP